MFFDKEDKTLKYMDQFTLDNFNYIQKKEYKFQSFTTKGKKNEISFNRNLAIGIIILILSIGIITLINRTNFKPNPIIGKWRTNTMVGIIEIEFKRNSMTGLGMTGGVTYEIKGNKVLVIDDGLKIGTTYIIHDQNTIYTDTFGIKSIYKRVE